MTVPDWISTDWTKAFFAAERQLSPKLEQLVRTDAFLDVLAVTNGLTAIAGRTVRDLGHGLVEAVGLPSSRQVQRLQRSVDALSRRTP
jgi:hypothetical protein